jgi:hypothetical protein
MFHKDVLLVWKYGNNTKLWAVVTFYNKAKYKEFLKSQDKKYWLQMELDLYEKYFANTYIDLEAKYFQEIDNKERLDSELKNADSFAIE